MRPEYLCQRLYDCVRAIPPATLREILHEPQPARP